MIDLRTLHSPLDTLLSSSPTSPSLGPLKSYPTLTELTRNPPSTRASIEKNWLLFFPPTGESYIHYDLPSASNGERGRTFAKLLGNGLTTTNLTSPLETSCLKELMQEDEVGMDEAKNRGTWHQATNSLRLILCNRSDVNCKAKPENTVFIALIHRKFHNYLRLPLRYERFFIVWASTPPFGMLALSHHPILLANETAQGWTEKENWDDDFYPTDLGLSAQVGKVKRASLSHDNTSRITQSINSSRPFPPPVPSQERNEKPFWAYFTYTVSIAYAWGRGVSPHPSHPGSQRDEAADMHVGYLDDEIVLGIGVDDEGQGIARVNAGELVGCMRACPGRVERRGTGKGKGKGERE